MRSERRNQRDLFEPEPAFPPLQPVFLTKLAPLLQLLLTEAAALRRPEAATELVGREGGDDQDHP